MVKSRLQVRHEVNRVVPARRPFEPADEVVRDPQRIAVVRQTRLLDSPTETPFDRLARLAVQLLEVPAAFLSVVDADRDFYKAAAGLGEALGSARQLEGRTFCHYAVATATAEGPLVISDTRADPVYRRVPTVESLGVAAYLGVPIVVRGQPIGAFCVIDVVPRHWLASEVDVLREIAMSAQREIDLRLSNARAERAARARTAMLALITNDLRDPFHAIFMSSSFLLELIPPESPLERTQAAVIRRAAARANRLIHDLLDISCLEGDSHSLDPVA